MATESWHAFYASDLQGTWALLLVPALFLLYWAASGGPSRLRAPDFRDRFIELYALVFCIETMVDPLATGPLTKGLALGDAGATAVMLLFVLLGDFRVFLLIFGMAGRGTAGFLREAALFTLIVPIPAWTADFLLRQVVDDLPAQTLWIFYEAGFATMALVLRGFVIPKRCAPDDPAYAPLRRAATFAAVYYGLWLTSDLLIVVGGLEVGWLLRVVPNQLYYSFWIPFVYASWPARR